MPRKILNDNYVLSNCPEYQPLGMPNVFLPKTSEKQKLAGQELIQPRQVPQNATIMDLVNNVNSVPVNVEERTQQLQQARARVRPSAPAFDPEMLAGVPLIEGMPPPTYQQALEMGMPPPTYQQATEELEEKEEITKQQRMVLPMVRFLSGGKGQGKKPPLFKKQFDERVEKEEELEKSREEIESYLDYKVLPHQALRQEHVNYLHNLGEEQRVKMMRNKLRGITKSRNAIINNLTKLIIPQKIGEGRAKTKAQIEIGFALQELFEDMEQKGDINAGQLLRFSKEIQQRLGFGNDAQPIEEEDVLDVLEMSKMEKMPEEPEEPRARPELERETFLQTKGVVEGEVRPELAIQLPKKVGQKKIPVEEQKIGKPVKVGRIKLSEEKPAIGKPVKIGRMRLRGSMAEQL